MMPPQHKPDVVTPNTDQRHIRRPAGSFYWALLDTAALPTTRRPSRQALGYLFEAVLPVPIEDVHAVYFRINDTTSLACGMQRSELERRAPGAALTLTPQELPDFIDADVKPQQLNLLTGPFAPPVIRKLRRRWLAVAAATALLLSALLVVGLERRAITSHRHAAQFRGQVERIAATVLGSDATNSALPLHLQLTAELRELQSTRDVEVEPIQQRDTALALAELLALWPADLKAQTSSISITPQTITIVVKLPEAAAAQQLADALAPLDNWSLHQPRINATGDGVRATLQMSYHPSPPPPESGESADEVRPTGGKS